MTLTTTYAKNAGWLERHFGMDGRCVITTASKYGYGVAMSLTPERAGYRFFVYKVSQGGDKRTPLGEFDTRDDAVNMLRLLTATEGNDDGNVD